MHTKSLKARWSQKGYHWCAPYPASPTRTVHVNPHAGAGGIGRCWERNIHTRSRVMIADNITSGRPNFQLGVALNGGPKFVCQF